MKMLTLILLLTCASFGQSRGDSDTNASLVTRMMAFDKNGDGKLTKDEVTDERLHRLFDRADSDKDGSVTKEELTTLAAKEPAGGGRGEFGAAPGGPPDNGGPGRGGQGGPGGRGMGGPQPGMILPSFVQDRLNLTDEQKKQVEELQAEVDKRLSKILTEEQAEQFKQMRARGPGGPRGQGGPGGFGGPREDGAPRRPTSRPTN